MSKATVILAALLLGLALGVVFDAGHEGLTETADVIGTLWLNGLRMTVVPLVVALLVTGIAQTAAAARAGKLAFRAVVTMITILWCSATMAAFVTPALLSAFPMPVEAGAALKQALSSAPSTGEVKPFSEFLRAIVPTNPFAAAASDAILPLIIFTMAFSFAVLRLPEGKRTLITGFFEALGDTMLIVINWVLAIAPIGVFALAYVVGAKAGTAALGALDADVKLVITADGQYRGGKQIPLKPAVDEARMQRLRRGARHHLDRDRAGLDRNRDPRRLCGGRREG